MAIPVGKRRLVAATTPIEGLTRRELPLVAVFTQSISAVAPSGTAAVTPALVIGTAGGGGAVMSFIAAAVVIILVSACLRPMAQRMAAVGGLYTYTARGLGPLAAIPTGWSAIVGYAAVAMASLIAVGTYVSTIATDVGLTTTTPRTAIAALAIVAAAAATVVMVRGIRISARVTLLIECVSLVLLGAIFAILVVSPSPHGAATIAASMLWKGGGHEVAINVVVAISAFVGFESATTLGGEARHPFQSVPRTLRWTPIAAAVAYLVAVPIQAFALAAAPTEVQASSTPLVALLAAGNSPLLSAVLDLAIATSFFACSVASVNALVRILFSMGREGVAPNRLGRTHPRFKTPVHGIVVAMVIVTAGAVGAVVLGVAPDVALRAFLTLSACGYIGSYLAGCAAAPALLRRIGELTPGIVVLSAVTTILLGAVAATAVVVAVDEGAVVPTIYLALLCLAVVHAGLLKWLAPARLNAVGIYDETQRTDVLSTVPFR